MQRTKAQGLCFNPYCAGCFSVAMMLGTGKVVLVMFQSLLCWMFLSSEKEEYEYNRQVAFQSLLCWMFLSSFTFQLQRSLGFLFQSLLCWMFLSSWEPTNPNRGESNVSILIVLDVSQ